MVIFMDDFDLTSYQSYSAKASEPLRIPSFLSFNIATIRGSHAPMMMHIGIWISHTEL